MCHLTWYHIYWMTETAQRLFHFRCFTNSFQSQHFSRLKKGIISASGDPATPKSKTLPSVSESGKSATPAKTSGKRKRGGKASIQEDDVEPDSAGDGSPKPKKLREAKAKLDTKASKSEDGSAAGVADKD